MDSMSRLSVVLLLLLSGCVVLPKPQGTRFVSPKYGVVYYGILADGAGIDQAADLWLNWCSIAGKKPGDVLKRCTIYVMAGETVNGVHAAWWYPNGIILVARDAPYRSDKYLGLDSAGLVWLRHEWIHELYRDGSHDQFPFPDQPK